MWNEQELRHLVERLIDPENINVQFRDVSKLSIQGLVKSCRNPIVARAFHSSIFAQVSSKIPNKKELYILYHTDKQKFKEKIYEVIINIIVNELKKKLESDDLPTPIFPTSVALSKIPNYYISQPKEKYNLNTKMQLFSKLVNSICGRCGKRIYGLYISEEWIKDILRDDVPDFYNVDILRISNVLQGKKTNEELRRFKNQVGPFEYLFYLLDKILQEMFRVNIIPNYYVELFVIEVGRGKKLFFSHYIIPNLNEIFYKLYHGNDKYTITGISKIKALISSLLVENWRIDRNMKKNYSEIAHVHINRLLYYIFCHRKLDIDSILFLEDLKIKLGDTTPIRYVDEVISWM